MAYLYFSLYVILDLFSRYVVGWMVAARERAQLAERLIAATAQKQGIAPHQLTIHADRGAPMRSKLVAELFTDLGIAASHSRPRVSKVAGRARSYRQRLWTNSIHHGRKRSSTAPATRSIWQSTS